MSLHACLKLGIHTYRTYANCWSLYTILVKIGYCKCDIRYSWKLEQPSMVTKILINIPFVKKLVNVITKSCKNNSGILDFVGKKIMRVFKCNIMNIEEIKLFLDTKPFLYLLCNEIEKGLTPWFVCYIGSCGLHSKQLNCFDVRNLQAIMNKWCDICDAKYSHF